ncbi:MAG TPA: hypothetical protein VHM90_06410 [Phycisphaerae bacterium]|jgi:hypothetical protein|nr:hypothetical protein [Phycisphaerae bacterium]
MAEDHKPEPPQDETPEERALSALRSRMARPQPKAAGDPQEDAAEESGVGSGSATGFVGMLAKRQLDGDSVAGVEVTGLEGEAARRARYPLQMAKEVVPPVGIEVPPAATGIGEGGAAARGQGGVRGAGSAGGAPWLYRLALPVSWALAMILVVIGAWAVGALVYMQQHNAQSHPPIMVPKDVHYPLIAWRFDAGPLGDYTPASKLMARAMMLCLPVAVLLVVVAGMVRKRVIRHAQA